MWEWIRYRALILAVFGGLVLMGCAGNLPIPPVLVSGGVDSPGVLRFKLSRIKEAQPSGPA